MNDAESFNICASLCEGEMISKTRISKGNLTVVPKHVRRTLGLCPGDLLEWSLEGGRLIVRPRKSRTLDDITGFIAVGGDAVADKRKAQRGDL